MLIVAAVALVAVALPAAASAASVPSWVTVYKIGDTASAYGQTVDTYCYGSPAFTDRASGVWLDTGGQWTCDGFQWNTGPSGTSQRWGRYTWGTKAFAETAGWTAVRKGTEPPGWMTVYVVGSTGSAYGQRLDRYCFSSPAFTSWPSGMWISTIYGWGCFGFETSSGAAGTYKRPGVYNYNVGQFAEWYTWSRLT